MSNTEFRDVFVFESFDYIELETHCVFHLLASLFFCFVC